MKTIWGPPKANGFSSSVEVLFDKHMRVPIELEWHLYRKGWDPKRFAELERDSFEKSKIGWTKFKSKGKELFLPTKIEIHSFGTDKEPKEVEVVNHIQWLLDDDVPDELFKDPSKNTIVEPTFPRLTQNRITIA